MPQQSQLHRTPDTSCSKTAVPWETHVSFPRKPEAAWYNVRWPVCPSVKISEQVANLEWREQQLSGLLNEIIATMSIKQNRVMLVSDEQGPAEWLAQFDRWIKRHEKITPPLESK